MPVISLIPADNVVKILSLYKMFCPLELIFYCLCHEMFLRLLFLVSGYIYVGIPGLRIPSGRIYIFLVYSDILFLCERVMSCIVYNTIMHATAH